MQHFYLKRSILFLMMTLIKHHLPEIFVMTLKFDTFMSLQLACMDHKRRWLADVPASHPLSLYKTILRHSAKLKERKKATWVLKDARKESKWCHSFVFRWRIPLNFKQVSYMQFLKEFSSFDQSISVPNSYFPYVFLPFWLKLQTS